MYIYMCTFNKFYQTVIILSTFYTYEINNNNNNNDMQQLKIKRYMFYTVRNLLNHSNTTHIHVKFDLYFKVNISVRQVILENVKGYI